MQERIDFVRFDSHGWSSGRSDAIITIYRVLMGLVDIVPSDTYFDRFTNRIRIGVLKIFGAKIGDNVIMRPCYIAYPWNVSIGNNVWIGFDVQIFSYVPIVIGDNVCVSQQAFLSSGGHDMRAPGFDLLTGPIAISDGVWIGARAVINPGITINEAAVVLPCSVVTKSLDAYSVYGGVPAKFIKAREVATNRHKDNATPIH